MSEDRKISFDMSEDRKISFKERVEVFDKVTEGIISKEFRDSLIKKRILHSPGEYQVSRSV